MKIIFLNTWGGRVAEPLKHFFETYQDVDVFCLQEVWSDAPREKIDHHDEMNNMFSQVGDILRNYEKIFAPEDENGDYGLAIYYKKSLSLIGFGDIMIHDKEEYFPVLDITSPKRNLQYLTLQIEDQQKVSILNLHGLWNGQGKDDTEDRLKQSENIISFLKTLNHPFVLGGDFNLSPNTQSLKMIEDFGLTNLIKEYGVTNTRTSYYTKENKFADYVFVSKGIQVEDFKVLPDEVSDHAPLYVKINA